MTRTKRSASVMLRRKAGDVTRMKLAAAKHMISQVDLLHVLINMWEGLGDADQQAAIKAAGEQRVIEYQAKIEQRRTPPDNQTPHAA